MLGVSVGEADCGRVWSDRGGNLWIENMFNAKKQLIAGT